MKKFSVNKIALCGILTACATISFILESLLPPIFLPGARIGFSNVFILLIAIILGDGYALIALVIKCIIGSLFSGNVSSLMYSLPAGLISLGIELALLRLITKFSLLPISAIGSVINITIQNLIFCVVTGTTEFIIYLPYLALIGFVSGVLIGFITVTIIKFFPNAIIKKIAN